MPVRFTPPDTMPLFGAAVLTPGPIPGANPVSEPNEPRPVPRFLELILVAFTGFLIAGWLLGWLP